MAQRQVFELRAEWHFWQLCCSAWAFILVDLGGLFGGFWQIKREPRNEAEEAMQAMIKVAVKRIG